MIMMKMTRRSRIIELLDELGGRIFDIKMFLCFGVLKNVEDK